MKDISSTDTTEYMYESLIKTYQAQKTEAVATLHIYFRNAAGIGEHPQMMEEMRKQVEIMANAEDCIEALKRNFG